MGVNAATVLAGALAMALVLGLAAPARAMVWSAGLDAGYAFRSQADGRNHGATAGAFLEIPLPGPLALRPEILALGFGGSKAAPGALGLFAGALSLVYSFDDTEAQALASLGPMAGLSVDAAAGSAGGAALRAGALASIGIRFPVADVARIEARVSLPAVLYGPHGVSAPGQAAFADGAPVDFPLQTTFQLGITVDLKALASELR